MAVPGVGLRIDAEMRSGISGHCETFDNPPLVSVATPLAALANLETELCTASPASPHASPSASPGSSRHGAQPASHAYTLSSAQAASLTAALTASPRSASPRAPRRETPRRETPSMEARMATPSRAPMATPSRPPKGSPALRPAPSTGDLAGAAARFRIAALEVCART